MSVYDTFKATNPAPVPTPEPSPAPTTGVYGTFKANTTNAPAVPVTGVYGAFKQTQTPPADPYFYAKTDEKGGAIGKGEGFDTSGKPFLGYRNPGDTATTTDKARVATTFDPRKASPLTKEQYYNPRAADLRNQLHDTLGIKATDELDHAIALTVGGTNQPENLRAIPAAENQKAGSFEGDLAQKLKEGKISYFEAQVADAKKKGVKVPWTPAQEKAGLPKLFEDTWNRVKNFLVPEAHASVYDQFKATQQPTENKFDKLLNEKSSISSPAYGANSVDVHDAQGNYVATFKGPDAYTQAKTKAAEINGKNETPLQKEIDQLEIDRVKLDETNKDDVKNFNTRVDSINQKITSSTEKPIGEAVITKSNPLGVVGRVASAIVKTATDTFNNTLDKVTSAVSSLDSRTPLQERGVKISEALLSGVNLVPAIFAFNAGLAGAKETAPGPSINGKELPSVNSLARGVEKLFQKIGQGSEKEVDLHLNALVDAGIISKDSADKLRGPATEAVSLINTIALGKATHLTSKLATEGVKLGKIINAEWESIPNKQGGFIKIPRSAEDVPQEKSSTTDTNVATKPPVYEGETDLSLKSLEKLKGRSSVSKQFISDLTNSADIKQTEKDVIRAELANYPDGKDIPVKEFANKVKTELLPLNVADRENSGGGGTRNIARYEGITLPEDQRGNVENYGEKIYTSPIKTSAGETHFSGQQGFNISEGPGKNRGLDSSYFGHTRVEDMADNDIRRVIEVQSDLFQRGRLEQETHYVPAPGAKPEYDPIIKNYSLRLANGSRHIGSEKDLLDLIKSEAPRANDLKKLAQYNNPSAHFRMVREEVKQAAADGKTKLQFPTGETAMKIEGLGRVDQWGILDNNDATLGTLTKENMEVGQKVYVDQGQNIGEETPWVITEVLGDGKFKAVSKVNLEKALENYGIAADSLDPIGQINYARHHFKMDSLTETFDISGKIDTTNPIYKFYEKDLGRYLKNTYNAKLITDPQGVKWYEVDIKSEHAKAPVQAFKKPLISKLPGPTASKEAIKSLISNEIPKDKLNLVFTPDLIDGTATGSYKSPRDVVKGVLKPLIELYEENGKVSVRTAYHEAYHYLFNNLLSEVDQKSALDLARKSITIFDKAKYKITGYKDEKILEEFLADQYAKQKASAAGFHGPFKTLFEKINSIIKNIIAKAKEILDRLNKALPEKGRQGGYVGIGREEPPVKKLSEGEAKDVYENHKDLLYKTKGKYPKINSTDEARVFVGEMKDTVFNSKALDGLPFQLNDVTVTHLFEKARDPSDFFRRAKLLGAGLEIAEESPNIASIEKKSDGFTYYEFLGVDKDNFPGKIIKSTISEDKNGRVFFSVHDISTRKAQIQTSRETPSQSKPGALNSQPPEGDRKQGGQISDFQKPESKLSERTIAKNENKVNQYKNPVEQQIQQLTDHIAFTEEAVKNNPAAKLTKFANKNGELPEVLGSGLGHGKFVTHGDDIVTELGYESSETARAEFANFKLQKRRLAEMKLDLQKIKRTYRENTSLNNEAKKLSTFLEKSFEKNAAVIPDNAKKTSLKPQESQQALARRKDLARKNLQALVGATYNTTPPLERTTPEHMLRLTEESYRMTLEEFERQNIDTSFKKILTDYQTPVKNKVGIIDTYLRTPDRVLTKLGLPNIAALLRHSYESYLAELPLHIELIKNWSKRVDPKANEAIFRFLDGQTNIDHFAGNVHTKLAPNEMKVAIEIKKYLAEWADRLGLPDDQKISHYITHLFGLGENEKEFDEDLAKIITDKVTGSVYDPFLEKRLGKKGYREDTWAALDAYVKRGVRKANMDPVLERLKGESERMEISQQRYIKRLTDNINMRPTDLDTAVDNSIKTFLGYKFGQRPVAYLSKLARQTIFRYSLGLNFGSALKNLTQGVNTYAKLGEKYTGIGYFNLLTQGSKELEESGVLGQDMVQDKVLSSGKKWLQRGDKALFYAFELAEKINRGAAYYGAKAKALAEGKDELTAMQEAKKMVRDTQFQFGAIDTPAGLNSDFAKVFTQFLTYGVKQAEFSAEMLSNKEWGGIIRYIVATAALVYLLGKSLNIKATDFIPGASLFKWGGPPALALPTAIIKASLDLPDNFGNKRTPMQKVTDVANQIPLPAGVQAKKTFRGASIFSTSKITDKVEKNPYNLIKALILGQQNIENKKDIVRKIYDHVKTLTDQGKDAEATTIVNDLSDEDYGVYEKILTAEKAKSTKNLKVLMQPTYDRIQNLVNQGRDDEAQKIIENMTDPEFKAYQLILKQSTP